MVLVASGRTVSLEEAAQMTVGDVMIAKPQTLPSPRLIVLDPDRVTLRGLLCANRTATGFCVG